MDRVRWFLEECDLLQGYQIMVDVDSVRAESISTADMRSAPTSFMFSFIVTFAHCLLLLLLSTTGLVWLCSESTGRVGRF